MATLEESVRDAVAGVADETAEIKAAVGAAAVTAAIPSPVGPEVNTLWKTLVSGLVAILVLSLGGIIYTVADANELTSPDVLVTVFSSVLTGLIGLFVRSPAQ